MSHFGRIEANERPAAGSEPPWDLQERLGIVGPKRAVPGRCGDVYEFACHDSVSVHADHSPALTTE